MNNYYVQLLFAALWAVVSASAIVCGLLIFSLAGVPLRIQLFGLSVGFIGVLSAGFWLWYATGIGFR